MSLFLFCKRKYLDGKEKKVIKLLLKFSVCHQVQMDLALLKISHKVFGLTRGSPEELHPKNSESIQAENLNSHALVALLHKKQQHLNLFGKRTKSPSHLSFVTDLFLQYAWKG